MPTPSRRLRHAPLALGISRAIGGFGMLELLLGAGVALAAAGLVFAGYKHAQAKAAVRNEVDNVRELSRAVERSFGAVGTYQDVSGQRVLADNLAPWRLRASATGLTNAWGGTVEVAPFTVDTLGDAFEVAYAQVPASACVPLAEHLARDAWDIRLGDVSVLQATGGLDPAVLARQCDGFDGHMAFVYHAGVPGQAVAAAPLVNLPPALPPTSATPPPPIAMPGVPAAPGTGPASLPPPVSVGCGPAPAAPACPWGPGYSFQAAPYPTCWRLAGSCATAPVPSSPPPASVLPPGGALPPPPPLVEPCEPRQEDRVAACPSGQYGQRNEHRDLTCGTVYGTPEAWATTWAAGPWQLVSSTCTSCPAPSTETTYQWVDTVPNCPAGDYGTWAWERQQRATRSVSYSCPSPTWTLPTPTYGGWSSWANTGAKRNEVKTCASCPPPQSQRETRWLSTAPNCPAGDYGVKSWDYEQARTRTGSYSCPAGTTTLPPISWAPWSSWANTGATRNGVDTCTACPPPSTETATAWFNPYTVNNCPAGRYGYTTREREYVHSRTRSYDCPAGQTTLPPASISPWGAWSGTGATRLKSTNCTACPPAATERQARWLSTAPNCPAGQYGTRSWDYEQARSRSVSYACPAGTPSLPAPTYGAWSSWANTGATRNGVDTCASCPAPSTIQQNQWASRSAPCPSGQTGSHTWEEVRERSRTRTYTCPAGTASLPAPTYSYGTWSWTGTKRNEVNTCAPTCSAPSPSSAPTSRQVVEERQLLCPVGEIGQKIQQRTNTEEGTITTTWTCPGPTSSTATTWSGTYTTIGTWETVVDTCSPGGMVGDCAAPCGLKPGWYWDNDGICRESLPVCK